MTQDVTAGHPTAGGHHHWSDEGGALADTTKGAPDLRSSGDRIEVLVEQLHATTDPRTADRIDEVLRLITELYGAGLERVLELARAEAPELIDQLVDDELVGSLLLVHDLHPEDLPTRLTSALDSVRPFLRDHGGDVQLLDIDAAVGAVHLRLLGSCDGCPSSAATLRDAVERAINDAAPEIAIIDVEQPSLARPATPIELGRKPEPIAR